MKMTLEEFKQQALTAEQAKELYAQKLQKEREDKIIAILEPILKAVYAAAQEGQRAVPINYSGITVTELHRYGKEIRRILEENLHYRIYDNGSAEGGENIMW